MKRIINVIKEMLYNLGYVILSREHFNNLNKSDLQLKKYQSPLIYSFGMAYSDRVFRSFLKFKPLSKAQLQQDLFVLCETSFKREGFFVEFGATNGVDLSNTWLLENKFSWRGILAEPAKCWHDALKSNRKVFIDTNCVWSQTDKSLDFEEVKYAELSTLSRFKNEDGNRALRNDSSNYKVRTVSLNDLLMRYAAPYEIDYLSIDTEGSEYEILSTFDFSKYKIKIITVEHNRTSNRQKIYSLLQSKGYIRKFENFSLFDDWYVLQEEL